MDNILLVGVLEGSADLFGHLDDGLKPFDIGLIEGCALDVFHDHEGLFIHLASIKHGHNVGMGKFCDGLRFCQQA